MAIPAIYSGPFCQGNAVASLVAERMGYPRRDDVIYQRAAERLNVSEDKLRTALRSGPGLFNKFTRDYELRIAHLRLALAEVVQDDNIVLHGDPVHLLPGRIRHALHVCLIANHDSRIATAMQANGISEKQAAALIHRGDSEREKWTRHVKGRSPYDPHLYDLVLPMHELSPDQAAGQVLLAAGNDALRTTAESQAAVRDFLLASRVWLRLTEEGHPVAVDARDGAVTVSINEYTSRLENRQRELDAFALQVEGVRSVRSVPGTGFVPPSLLPGPDLPSRVLLVDDEREFVHSLSERLQARQFDASVVYTGEEALAAVSADQPQVMVLDLKMPGIGGMDVLRDVKRDHPEVEVIILTGHGSERERQLAMELGAFAYLTKPVNIDQLANTMREAYARTGRVELD